MLNEETICLINEIYADLAEYYEDNTLQALCLDCSREIKKKLPESVIVQGIFCCDEYDYDDGEEIYDMLHYWIEYDGFVIDITSKQFQEFCDEELEFITILPKKDAYEWRYKK